MPVWRYEKGHVINKRLLLLFIFFLLLFMVLIGRLIDLQIFQNNTYQALSERNRTAVRPTLPARGYIYDKNGLVFAENKKNFHASFIREQAKDVQQSLNRFFEIISVDSAEKERILKEVKNKRAFVPVILKENLTFDEIAELNLKAPELLGVVIEEGFSRFYGAADSVAHLIGYLSTPTEDDIKKNPKLADLVGLKIGVQGVEKSAEELLRGTAGTKKTEINAFGRTVRVLEENLPTTGKDIYLTVDSRLQQYATRLLQNESASAIVVNVNTGEVLAMVSTPTYDTNIFTNPIPVPVWKKLIENPKNPLANKAMSGVYSPGSIFKLVVALAGLESGLLNPKETVNCTGHIMVGKRKFHCWKEHGHGKMDLIGGIQNSCDVYFYKMAQKIGPEKIIETAKKLGFGEKTGIDLPNEKSGLLPSPEWKLRVKKDGWRLGDTVNLSIGQGYLSVTPLQLLMAVTQIANGGKQITPFLIQKETHEKTEKLPFSSRNLKLLRQGMDAVVNSDRGTARGSAFKFNGMKMAGKTASTQVRTITLKERKEGLKKQQDIPWEHRDHGLFAAFAPVDNPKYAVIVVVEHGGGGSSSAAPVAGKILKRALQLDMEDSQK